MLRLVRTNSAASWSHATVSPYHLAGHQHGLDVRATCVTTTRRGKILCPSGTFILYKQADQICECVARRFYCTGMQREAAIGRRQELHRAAALQFVSFPAAGQGVLMGNGAAKHAPWSSPFRFGSDLHFTAREKADAFDPTMVMMFHAFPLVALERLRMCFQTVF